MRGAERFSRGHRRDGLRGVGRGLGDRNRLDRHGLHHDACMRHRHRLGNRGVGRGLRLRVRHCFGHRVRFRMRDRSR